MQAFGLLKFNLDSKFWASLFGSFKILKIFTKIRRSYYDPNYDHNAWLQQIYRPKLGSCLRTCRIGKFWNRTSIIEADGEFNLEILNDQTRLTADVWDVKPRNWFLNITFNLKVLNLFQSEIFRYFSTLFDLKLLGKKPFPYEQQNFEDKISEVYQRPFLWRNSE